MSEVMRLVGKSLAPEVVMREMLHLMSELLGLNRGRIVLADFVATWRCRAGDRKPATRAPDAPRASFGHSLCLWPDTAGNGTCVTAGRRHHRPRAGHGAAHHRAGHRRRATVSGTVRRPGAAAD